MRRRVALLGVIAVLFGAVVLAADAENGEVVGEITFLTNDGKAVQLAFVDVGLKGIDTAFERETRGDVDGRYAFADVPSGRYEIRFEHPTHLSFARNDLVVRANRTLRVNVQMLPEDFSTDESPAEPSSEDPSRRLKALALPGENARS